MAGFDPLMLPLSRELDEAHEQGFRAFLSRIGHNESSPVHRRNAANALVNLESGLRGRASVPDYSEPLVAAAYMAEYHLSHCALAYWSFQRLFEQFGIPGAIYVCDVGAGTGAGRVGLALALSKCSKVPEVFFDACEPSQAMRSSGECFWESFQHGIQGDLNSGYRSCPELPPMLPDTPDGALRVVTAFHLSLPWNDYDRLAQLTAAQSALRSALNLVSPNAGLFTCNENKDIPLIIAVDGYSAWDYGSSTTVNVSDAGNGVDNSSRFYTDCAEELGFTAPEGEPPVKTWSRHRFSLPKGGVLIWRVSPK